MSAFADQTYYARTRVPNRDLRSGDVVVTGLGARELETIEPSTTGVLAHTADPCVVPTFYSDGGYVNVWRPVARGELIAC